MSDRPFIKVGIRTLTDERGKELYVPIISLPFTDRAGVQNFGVFEFEYSTERFADAEEMLKQIAAYMQNFGLVMPLKEYDQNVN